MSVMTTRYPDVPDRRLTVDDLESIPDDGRRYELADGRLDVSPAPKPWHTLVESRLTMHLGYEAPDELSVITNPGILLGGDPSKHRIPDLAVFDYGPPEEGYYTAPPLLAIEVVSPDSILRDNHTKRREYAAAGIPSYWIINPNPEKPEISEFRLIDGEYREMGQTRGEELFETEFPFTVSFVPHWLVASGPWRRHIGGSSAH